MRTNSRRVSPRADDGRADRGRQPVRARGGSADRPVPAGADPAATGAVRSGRSDVQDLQAAVFRLSSRVLADRSPPGWGCPSPRLPNKEQSFRESAAREHPRGAEAAEMPPPDDGGAPPPRRPPRAPVDLPPERRSPFDETTRRAASQRESAAARQRAPDAAAEDRWHPVRGPQSREGRRMAPSAEPVAEARPPRRRRRRGRRNSRHRPAAAGAGLGVPSDETSRRRRRPRERQTRGPCSACPIRTSSAPMRIRGIDPSADASAAGSPPSAASASPAAQPRRRIFGNLFSSLGANWTRR